MVMFIMAHSDMKDNWFYKRTSTKIYIMVKNESLCL